jgi:hypothetical protein
LIKRGKAINRVIDGAISQTMFCENSTALALSLVSTYIHVMANIETNGIAASIAPASGLLLEISEINTIKSVVIISLVI